MNRTRSWSLARVGLLVASGMVVLFAPSAPAQDVTAPADPPKMPDDKPKGAEEKPKAPEEKPEFPPFDEVSKDHDKIPGFFDIYYDKKKDHALAVIPEKMMGKNFLVLSSIAGGPAFTGFMWDGYVAQWRQMDKKLVLLEPDLRYDRAKKSTVEDVVSRTYTDRIVLSTKIVSKRGGDLVIDLDDVFKNDRVGLADIYHGSVEPSLSRWATTKGFEKNVELEVDAAVMAGRDGGTRARVHYSISELPENDYTPRKADPRVGYFMTAIKNWGREHNDKTVFDRYVHRWRLRKADAKAAVSDVHPDDQIVFYVEKTVPVKYRRYVREGILEWNQAFEKIGLLNALAVRQQTDTNEWKDLDPEDVRYNFFRWIVSGAAFAMGPSRVNPMTGQILDADIIWDDSLVRSLLNQYARLSARGPSASYDPQLQEFLERQPQWSFLPQEEVLLPASTRYGGANLSWNPQMMSDFARRQPAFCACAQGVSHELALAGFVSRAEGQGGLSDEFIGAAVKYIVAHEVGHTLGLRHNFKASSWKALSEVLAAKGEGIATSGSVMDYCPAMYAASLEDQKNFYTSTVGPYDVWAIEYGYRHTDDTLKSEDELLKAVASRGNEPGLAYGTDEDAGFLAPDPMVNVYDYGDDPLAFATHRMEIVQKLQKNIETWAVEDGESYSRLRRAFDTLLFEYGRVGQLAARLIGGQYVSRNHKGDLNEKPPFEIVPVEKQRAALDFIIARIFSDEAFRFAPEFLTRLAPGRWGHWDSDDYDSTREYPVHDRIAAAQYWTLFHLLNPFTLTRIYDAEIKVPADRETLTVPDLITKTAAAVWAELGNKPASAKWTNRKPFISSVRRSLQRAHLNLLTTIVLSRPGSTMPADAHAVVRMTLKGLAQQIDDLVGQGKGDALDAFSKGHLEESKARIEKALDADFQL